MPAIGSVASRLFHVLTLTARPLLFGGSAAIAALLLLVALLYVTAPQYAFAPAEPFIGHAWYNPYGALSADGARWLQANFHAHSRAWGGTTNGRHSPAHVAAAYAAMGYDIIGISNYHQLPAQTGTSPVFPVFEHGWNLWKSHRLALGAQRVVWRDYPLGQLVHHKQDMIHRLRAAGAVVAIAHPAMHGGHSQRDFTRLSGFDAIEVLNHFLPPAEAEWDAALSHGRAAWVLANDDSHDITGPGETGVHWTLVHARSAGTADVLDAIRAGRTIGVRGTGGRSALRFHEQRLRGDTLEILVSGPVRAIEFVGQGGVSRRVVTRDSLEQRGDTIIARAVALETDGYLRAVVLGEEPNALHMLGSALYLNPVIRWNGVALGAPPASIDGPGTLLARLFLLAAFASAGAASMVQRRGRRRVEAPAPTPALA